MLLLSAWVGKEVEGAPTTYTTTTRCEQVGAGGLTTCVDESGTVRTGNRGGGDDAIGSMYLPAGTPTVPCLADDAPWTKCVRNQAGTLVRADVEPGPG